MYMQNFPYSISVKLGKVYSQEFKEFHEWCHKHLGKKYKDWFIVANGVSKLGTFTLYLKDNKMSMFLALKYSESIDSSNLHSL